MDIVVILDGIFEASIYTSFVIRTRTPKTLFNFRYTLDHKMSNVEGSQKYNELPIQYNERLGKTLA
jgi:hypothetical protein